MQANPTLYGTRRPGIVLAQNISYQNKVRVQQFTAKADPVGFSAEQYPSHTSVVYAINTYAMAR